MKLSGVEIKDECERCGDVLFCKLTRQGHAIGQIRSNMTEMVKCQLRHKDKLDGKRT